MPQVKPLPMVFAVAIIFIANAFGYLMNYLYFAPKFRQLRVVTVIEAIRMRFGKVNEQVFTWSGMPNSVISAGIWLNGLAIIASGIFGFRHDNHDHPNRPCRTDNVGNGRLLGGNRI